MTWKSDLPPEDVSALEIRYDGGVFDQWDEFIRAREYLDRIGHADMEIYFKSDMPVVLQEPLEPPSYCTIANTLFYNPYRMPFIKTRPGSRHVTITGCTFLKWTFPLNVLWTPGSSP